MGFRQAVVDSPCRCSYSGGFPLAPESTFTIDGRLLPDSWDF